MIMIFIESLDFVGTWWLLQHDQTRPGTPRNNSEKSTSCARTTTGSVNMFEGAAALSAAAHQMAVVSKLQSCSPAQAAAAPKLMKVAKLVESYLAEVARDKKLPLSKFQALAEALPEFMRISDDGLYRAIDTYLKVRSWETLISTGLVTPWSPSFLNTCFRVWTSARG